MIKVLRCRPVPLAMSLGDKPSIEDLIVVTNGTLHQTLPTSKKVLIIPAKGYATLTNPSSEWLVMFEYHKNGMVVGRDFLVGVTPTVCAKGNTLEIRPEDTDPRKGLHIYISGYKHISEMSEDILEHNECQEKMFDIPGAPSGPLGRWSFPIINMIRGGSR